VFVALRISVCDVVCDGAEEVRYRAKVKKPRLVDLHAGEHLRRFGRVFVELGVYLDPTKSCLVVVERETPPRYWSAVVVGIKPHSSVW